MRSNGTATVSVQGSGGSRDDQENGMNKAKALLAPVPYLH